MNIKKTKEIYYNIFTIYYNIQLYNYIIQLEIKIIVKKST